MLGAQVWDCDTSIVWHKQRACSYCRQRSSRGDPGTENDEVKTLIGKSSGGFPLSTRQEQGIDLPAAPAEEVSDRKQGVTPSGSELVM